MSESPPRSEAPPLEMAVLAYALLPEPQGRAAGLAETLDHQLALAGGVALSGLGGVRVACFGSALPAWEATRALVAMLRGAGGGLEGRVVLDVGPVRRVEGRAQGAAVERACIWMLKGGDAVVIATHDFVDRLPRAVRATLTLLPIEQAPDLHRVDLPPGLALPDPRGALGARLSLRQHQTEVTVAPEQCPWWIGRDPGCASVLAGEHVSRRHGHIDFQDGQFYYVDASRNGSYLLTSRGDLVRVHGTHFPLVGRGIISPGAPVTEQTGEVLRYAAVPRAFEVLVEEARSTERLRA